MGTLSTSWKPTFKDWACPSIDLDLDVTAKNQHDVPGLVPPGLIPNFTPRRAHLGIAIHLPSSKSNIQGKERKRSHNNFGSGIT